MTRIRVDLHRLPQWLQYAIAIVVSALVMWLAWRVGRNRPDPPWLGPFMYIWLRVGTFLLVFFIVKWLVNKIRDYRK